MADVLDRIEKLVAVAASPNEEEARTAAVFACRMMLKHKVKFSLPEPEQEDNPAESGYDAESEYDDREQPEPRRQKRKRAKQSEFQTKIAPGDGHCKWCGKLIRRGAWCIHKPRWYYHTGCAEKAVNFFGVALDEIRGH
jgi:hypothetical protein